MTFKKTVMLFFATTCLAGPLAVQQVNATQVAVQPGGQENVEERIVTSVKIKMRSQSIAASVCHLQSGIESAALAAPLDTQIADFEKFVSAVTFGDADLNIVEAEKRGKTIEAIRRVTDAWAPVKVAADKIAAGSGGKADTDQVLVGNLEVLDHGHNFTAELVQQYANPAKATLADLMTIVLATRQGMLSQKMSKQACMVSYSGGDAAAELGKTMDIFDATLNALRHGMPAAGIGAPPNGDVAASLEEAAAQWKAVQPLLTEAKAGTDIGTDAHIAKMQQLDALSATMMTVAGHYVDYTKSKVK